MLQKKIKISVTIKDFEEARDKVIMGKEIKTILLSEEEKKLTAYHEAGHALVLLSQPEDSEPLHKVTIIPRGRAFGVTWWLPERDKYQETKREIIAAIRVAMGGRAAEDLVFNDKNVTSGCQNDFAKATELARKMVCLYGMSHVLGPVVYSQSQGTFEYSQHTAEMIDTEVRNLMNTAYEESKRILQENRQKLDTLAQALIEKETLYAEEIYKLLDITPRTLHSFN